MISHIRASFKEAESILKQFNEVNPHFEVLQSVATLLVSTFRSGNKVIICGNGGSACDAMHFAEEFTGRYRKNRKALPVISLNDAGHITCVANDLGFEHIFSRGIEAFGKEGDLFIGLSTSGNSPNIVNAFEMAKSLSLNSVSLLGKDGGKLLSVADYQIIVPGDTADRIQELHMLILHVLIEAVERELFPDLYL